MGLTQVRVEGRKRATGIYCSVALLPVRSTGSPRRPADFRGGGQGLEERGMSGRDTSMTPENRVGAPLGDHTVSGCCRIRSTIQHRQRAFVPVFVFGALLEGPVHQLTAINRIRSIRSRR